MLVAESVCECIYSDVDCLHVENGSPISQIGYHQHQTCHQHKLPITYVQFSYLHSVTYCVSHKIWILETSRKSEANNPGFS